MSDPLVDNSFFYKSAVLFVKYFSWITKIITVLFIIGVYSNKPSSFLFVNSIVKIFMALFLIYRFNSYRKEKIKFTELDRKICYSAGLYILLVSFFDIIQSYVDKLRNIVQPNTTPIIDKIKSYFE
jgi:hypothetical protein